MSSLTEKIGSTQDTLPGKRCSEMHAVELLNCKSWCHCTRYTIKVRTDSVLQCQPTPLMFIAQSCHPHPTDPSSLDSSSSRRPGLSQGGTSCQSSQDAPCVPLSAVWRSELLQSN